MHYISLPDTCLKVSQICFGGEQLGGFDLGHYDLNETIKSAKKGIDFGINFFDTADCYALGQSEKNLGNLVKGIRDKIIISSKFGVKVNPNAKKNRITYDNSKNYINVSVEKSLNRLQTDYIDIYQVHYWDGKTPLQDIFETLENLCESGKIRYYGITNTDSHGIKRKDFAHLISFSQEYGLANRSQESTILDYIENGWSFFAFGTLGQGILTGKYSKQSVFGKLDRRRHEKYINFFGKKLEKNLKIVDTLKRISKNYDGATPTQIALRWILEKIPNTIIISGIKNRIQLKDNVNIFNIKLNKDEIDLLEKVSS